MIWGYNIGSGVSAPLPINLEIKSHCHALITGSSGSGKSYGMLFLIGALLKENPEIEIYLCDFKNSEDFDFLSSYVHYYGGNDCYNGVMEYYNRFGEDRANKTREGRKLLIFDEYPAAISYYATKDKQEKTKYSTELVNAIAEILMLGRGIGYGVWVVTQRADASLFANGARDNFMVFLGLGRMSKEQKGMIFAGEDVPNKIYQRGEGCLLADGYPLMEVKIPKIKNIVNWKRHIKDILCGKD